MFSQIREITQKQTFYYHLLNLQNLRENLKSAAFNFIGDKIFAP